MTRHGCAICIQLSDGSFYLEAGFDHHLLEEDQDCICEGVEGEMVGCENITTKDTDLTAHKIKTAKQAISLLPDEGSVEQNLHWQRRLREELTGAGYTRISFNFGVPSFH